MAKPKLTVTIGDVVVAKRSTDRTYSHAVLLLDFNPERYRAIEQAAARRYDGNGFDYVARVAAATAGVPVTFPDHRRPIVLTYTQADIDQEKATLATWGGTRQGCIDAHIAAADKRIEESIVAILARKDFALSWHGTHALALKAQAAAVGLYLAYTLVVAPVDCKVAA